MKKFKDNEIIKAVGCCMGFAKCNECPMRKEPHCISTLFSYVFELIYRYKGKIKKLEIEFQSMRNAVNAYNVKEMMEVNENENQN